MIKKANARRIAEMEVAGCGRYLYLTGAGKKLIQIKRDVERQNKKTND